MAQEAGGSGVGFALPPMRTLELRDGTSEVSHGPLSEVPRVVVETGVLAVALGQRGEGQAGWSRVRAHVWERALADANLIPLIEQREIEGPAPLCAQLRTIRDRLAELRHLEQRLGERAEEGGTIPQSEHDNTMLILCAAGVVAAFAPAELRPFFGAGFALFAGRIAWQQWSPSAKVDRAKLASARVAVGRAIQAFLEHSWVAALGDRVVESTPHAVYLHHRLMDLDGARGSGEARVRELRGLIERIRKANEGLGREGDDAETRRLQKQIDDLLARLALIDRLRADCAARAEAHVSQLDRQRAIAARRALSSRVSSLVDRDTDDAADKEIAVLEVDIADLASRLRGLEVEIGSADAELRSVLEVAGTPGARPALRSRGRA